MSDNVLAEFVGALFLIILLPFILIFIAMSITACILVVVGTILTGVGKTNAGASSSSSDLPSAFIWPLTYS